MNALWVQMPILQAEEELRARSISSHPHLAAEDQRSIVGSLTSVGPVQKATRAEIAALGIRVE